MKYITGFGLLMLVADYLMIRMDIRRYFKKIDNIENEKNALKAQMYDVIQGSSDTSSTHEIQPEEDEERSDGTNEPSDNDEEETRNQ